MKQLIVVTVAAAALGTSWPAAAQERVEVQAATVAVRYKVSENSAGGVTANHVQENGAFKVRFSADRRRRLSIVAGAATGAAFTSGWNNTGVGTGEAKHRLFMKQLYVAAAPGAGVELQAGGLSLVRGESTEITSYDNDGYVVGSRLSLRRSARVFFDELSMTAGYVGDAATPSVFRRFDRMDRLDYYHMLVAKKVGARVALSADYTRHADVGTIRQAIAVKRPGAFVDALRFEQYQRVDAPRAYGFAVQADRSFGKRVGVGGGFATIDRNFGGLNGDRYFSGRRVFGSATLAMGPGVTTSVYMTRALATDVAVANGTRVDVVMSYNLAKVITRNGK